MDFTRIDSNGFLVKQEVADLLRIEDPRNLSGLGGGLFRFPFQTIESVIPMSATTIGVLNDNNYPFSNGRTPGQPDPLIVSAGTGCAVLSQARPLHDHPRRAISIAAQLDGAFGEKIDIILDIFIYFVEELVKSDEIRSFHVPMGVLALCL